VIDGVAVVDVRGRGDEPRQDDQQAGREQSRGRGDAQPAA
jgi:hypothetical protein